MTQKVLKVGTSSGVIIPKDTMKELGIKAGDEVRVELDRKRRVVTIQPEVTVNDELLLWTKQFIERYRPALKRLAKE